VLLYHEAFLPREAFAIAAIFVGVTRVKWAQGQHARKQKS